MKCPKIIGSYLIAFASFAGETVAGRADVSSIPAADIPAAAHAMAPASLIITVGFIFLFLLFVFF
jgi:hypothetical protein